MSERWILPGPTTFYIGTNGSDPNDGLSSSTPWATFAHAMAVLAGQIDFAGQAVTLQAVSGHAAFTEIFDVKPWVGAGSLTYDGASGSIAGVGGAIQALTATCPGPIACQNVTLSTSGSGSCLQIFRGNNFNIGPGVVFGSAAQSHIDAEAFGTIRALADYTISGGAQNHFFTDGFGVIAIFGRLITISNNPTVISGFFINDSNGQIATAGNVYVNPTFATGGSRYRAKNNGIIVDGGSINQLTNLSAGSVNTGGQYA